MASSARQGRFPARGLGHDARVDGRGHHLHHPEAPTGSHRRFLTDSRNIDDQLCRRRPHDAVDGWRFAVGLRLVSRSSPASPETWGEQTDVHESADSDWVLLGMLTRTCGPVVMRGFPALCSLRVGSTVAHDFDGTIPSCVNPSFATNCWRKSGKPFPTAPPTPVWPV